MPELTFYRSCELQVLVLEELLNLGGDCQYLLFFLRPNTPLVLKLALVILVERTHHELLWREHGAFDPLIPLLINVSTEFMVSCSPIAIKETCQKAVNIVTTCAESVIILLHILIEFFDV